MIIIFSGQPSTNRTEHPYAGSFILHVGPKERCDGLIHDYFFLIRIVVYFCCNYFCAGGKIKVLEIHSHPKKALYYYYDVCISTTSRWSVVTVLSCTPLLFLSILHSRRTHLLLDRRVVGTIQQLLYHWCATMYPGSRLKKQLFYTVSALYTTNILDDILKTNWSQYITVLRAYIVPRVFV